MAAAILQDPEQVEKKEKDLTKCGICLCLVQEPKSLSCLHSFCRSCIVEWAKDDTDKITCPVCKETSPLPKGGIDGLRGNFFIERVKKMKEMRAKLSNKKMPCSCCEVADSISNAWCADCEGHYLCSECIRVHKTYKPLQGHKIHTFLDIESGKVDIEKTPLQDQEYCDRHTGQIMWFYCETCATLICRDCSVVDHPASTHKLVNVEDVSGAHGQKLAALSSQCEKVTEQVDQAMKCVDDIESKLNKATDTAKTEIVKTAEKIKEKVLTELDEKKQQLLNELDAQHKVQKSQINVDRDRLKSQHLQLEQALAVTAHVTEKGSLYDLAGMYSSLTDTMQRLTKITPSDADKVLSYLKFEPTAPHHVEVPMFGSIASRHNLKRHHDLAGTWIKEDQICENSGLDEALNMEFFSDKEIGITDLASSQVHVVSNTGQLKYNINVKLDSSKSRPVSVVMNSSGLIFVTDGSPFVKIFYLTGSLRHKFKAILPGYSYYAQTSSLAGIAINQKQDVFVGDFSRKYISVRKSSGDHIRSFGINIAPCFISSAPSQDVLVVSNTEKFPPCAHIMTSTGQVLHRLNSAPVPTKPWYPAGACFNGDDEFLISSHSNNDKKGGIYHYSTNGKYLGCITNDVQEPRDVAITTDGKLYVLEAKHIKVFKKK